MVWELFTTFFKIGAFTFGGGYAMIPIIQKEVVEKKRWVDDDDFMDSIALAQASPGPVAVNSSIFIGYRLRGFKGAIVCTLGTVLPSFITILLVAMFFYQFRENEILDKIFMGVRPAVVALIATATYNISKKSNMDYIKISISLATILLIVSIGISPIWLVIAGGVGGVFLKKYKAENM